MRKFPKWLSLILVLCMVCSFTPLAFASSTEGDAAAEPAVTEEAAAEPAAEEAAVEEPAATEEAAAEPAAEEAAVEEPAADQTADDAAADTAATDEAGADEAPAKAAGGAKWNVLLYLCGTDLETFGGMATANLEMISKTTPVEDVNVLIETGGTRKWHAKDSIDLDIASDRLQRWHYGVDGFTLVDEQEAASMARYSTLADFIKWSAENYPAERNLLVLWDHGGGSASGLIQDELNDYALMSLEGLERALKEGGIHSDLFMTATCLMASLETAQVVKDSADYLLASEEVLPGLGSNYKEWLQDLYNEPECSAVRLGKNICNATEIMYAEEGDDANLKGLTFSVIDLSHIDAVAEAFEGYMKEAVGLLADPADFGLYLEAVSQTDRYMDRNMWDLYDLARRSINGGISKETALKLENAVDDAVITNVRGSYHPYAHGLSAFLCFNGENRLLDRLIRAARNPWQLAFLDATNLKWDAPAWVTDIVGEIPQLKPELYTVDFNSEVKEDQSNVLLHFNSGFSSGGFIRYELQRYDEQYELWYSLGTSEEVNLVEAGAESFTVESNFTGKWPAINGAFLSIESKDLQGNTVLLQAPVFSPMLGGVKKLRVIAKYPEEMVLMSAYEAEDAAEENAANGAEEGTEEAAEGAEGTDASAEGAEEGAAEGTEAVAEEPAEATDAAAEGTAEGSEEAAEEPTSYELAGIWNGYDSSTGLCDRNTWSMAELNGLGIQICKPVFSDYLEAIGDMRFGDEITIGPELTVEEETLPAGKYRMRYSISDMLDRTYESQFITLNWDGEKATFESPEEAPAEEGEEGGEGGEA